MSKLEFNQLLLNNADFLKPFAVNLTRDSEAAKDLYQETLFKAIANTAEGKLRLKEINATIHELPEIFKTPFLLYFEGYKYHEISDILQEPLGTIKSRIHFARKLLKEQISRY